MRNLLTASCPPPSLLQRWTVPSALLLCGTNHLRAAGVLLLCCVRPPAEVRRDFRFSAHRLDPVREPLTLTDLQDDWDQPHWCDWCLLRSLKTRSLRYLQLILFKVIYAERRGCSPEGGAGVNKIKSN